MLAYEENPDIRFFDIWHRMIRGFSDVFMYRRYANHSLSSVHDLAGDDAATFAEELANAPQYRDLFKDKEGFFSMVGGVSGLSSTLTQDSISSYRTVIDNSSVILAHSALDAAASDYFIVVALVAPPEDFHPFIRKKTITLERMRDSTFEEECKREIKRFVEEMDRKSLMRKIDTLFSMCRPPNPFNPVTNYVYERGRVEILDRLRHGIIHEDGIDVHRENCDDDILYLRNTGTFLASLINYKYDVRFDAGGWGDWQKAKGA